MNFDHVASLFENLPIPSTSIYIKSMEEFNQGWGSILYRTILPTNIKEGIILKINEVHDWAQIFVDGQLMARLDRRNSEFETILPDIKKGAQLDILVEAMGRVNFDKSIHDRKGITEDVFLIDGDGNSTSLKNWEVYNFSVDYAFVSNHNFIPAKQVDKPAYYKAAFNIDEIGDTFLDMSTWGKGMVWVNGHSLGRFWEIGPQQTLFMPGCWLNKGENEIIVLDLKGPKLPIITGITHPILDQMGDVILSLNRKEDETLSLSNENPVWSGTFIPGNGWQEVNFNTPINGRYFCLEALSSQITDDVAAIAELEILDEDRNPLLREHLKLCYADSEETKNGNCTADKIFDLQEFTNLITEENKHYSHYLVSDLVTTHTSIRSRY